MSGPKRGAMPDSGSPAGPSAPAPGGPPRGVPATGRPPPAPSRWSDRAALLGIVVAWAAFFAHVRTIGAGYHLQDDHEILRITAELRGASFIHVAWQWIERDLSIRLRPLYYLHRVGEAAVFGDRLAAWSVYNALLAVLTAALLYLALRTWRFPILAALAFPFLGLVGYQTAIWWRLGPAETVGMACLSVALLGLARWSVGGRLAWRAVFWAGAALASLSKESFTLLLPALAVGAVWSAYASRAVGLLAAVRTCLPDLAILGALLAGELAAIFLSVGTEQLGYAGVRGVTLAEVAAAAAQLLRPEERSALVALAVLGCATRGWAGIRAAGPAAMALAVVGAGVIGSQALLYARSGIGEHYLAPGTLGFALAAACGVRWAVGPSGEVAAAPRPRALAFAPILARAVAPILALAVLARVGLTRTEAAIAAGLRFGADGRETTAFLTTLSASPGPLGVAGGVPGVAEYFWSIRWYLRIAAGRDDVRFLFLPPAAPLTPFERGLVVSFERSGLFPGFDAVGPLPITVGVLRGDEAAFIAAMPASFPERHAALSVPGGFAIYTRR
jgi:hypothetical protein